jgi:hypothetical protein
MPVYGRALNLKLWRIFMIFFKVEVSRRDVDRDGYILKAFTNFPTCFMTLGERYGNDE